MFYIQNIHADTLSPPPIEYYSADIGECVLVNLTFKHSNGIMQIHSKIIN